MTGMHLKSVKYLLYLKYDLKCKVAIMIFILSQQYYVIPVKKKIYWYIVDSFVCLNYYNLFQQLSSTN